MADSDLEEILVRKENLSPSIKREYSEEDEEELNKNFDDKEEFNENKTLNEDNFNKIYIKESFLNKSQIKFKVLTQFFQKTSEIRGKKKTDFVTNVLKNCFFKKGDRLNSFLILRLILPDQDRERGNYGLKEIALGKLIGLF